MAVGGLAGTVIAHPLHRMLGLRALLGAVGLLQAGVLIMTGLSSVTALVVAGLVVFGAASMVWNVLTVSLRQRIVPASLLGRVTSSYE